jgi:hypothetical protein
LAALRLVVRRGASWGLLLQRVLKKRALYTSHLFGGGE